MSDFYDSLEDDSNDSDSLKQGTASKTSPPVKDFVNETSNKYSFYLNQNAPEERENTFPNFLFNPIESHNESKNFLPKVEIKKEKGTNSILREVFDTKILNKQGLQFNDDGSFTKSPRSDTEKLPFITREYRNLQLQKKKTYQLNKNTSDKARKKREIPLNQSINVKGSEGNKVKLNLTDTMKEKLLKNQAESPSVRNETTRTLKKTKCEMSFGSFCQNQKPLKYPNVNCETHKKNFFPESCKNSKTNTKCNIYKYQSDILLKPKLNYTERHLMRKGFNPLYLRQWNEKDKSSTNRSVFGDSTVEELSGVSAKSFSCVDGINEDEELFYKKLIEKDKQQNQCTARSDGIWDMKQPKSLAQFNNHRDQTKEIVKHNLPNRRKTKSLSINFSSESQEKAHSEKKSSHYCSSHPSSNLSKSELALKAKTYGYLVNARNIFKLKTQAEAKQCVSDNSSLPKKSLKVDGNELYECSLLPTKKLLSKESGNSRNTPKLSRETNLIAAKNSAKKTTTHENFSLPHVKNLKGNHIQSEVLQRVSSCLKSWNDLL